MNTFRAYAVSGLAAITLVTLAACSGTAGNADGAAPSDNSSSAELDFSQADREGRVVVGEVMQFITLDPADIESKSTESLLIPIYDTLLRLSPEGEIEPGLAEEWAVVDSSTISLTLRPDMTFSDGTPVDADAVRINLERMKAVDTGELNLVLQDLAEVVAVSPTEVELRLSAPVAGEFSRILYGPESLMISPTALEAGIDTKTEAVGAGPYEVVEYRPEQRLVLERKEDYWDADSWPIKTLEFRGITDGTAVVTALSAGDIQFAVSSNPTVVPALANNPTVELLTAPGQYLYYVNVCKNRAPFDDPEIRRAFDLAIDRDALTSALTDGRGEPTAQVWAPSSPYASPELLPEYDPEAARELIDGRDITATMGVITRDATFTRASEIMQAQLAEVGIDLTLNPTEEVSVAIADTNDSYALRTTHQGVAKISRYLGPDSVNNHCGYSDPELDALLGEIAAADPESDEAEELWHEVNTIVHDDTLFLPLYFQPSMTAFNAAEVSSIAFSTPSADFRYVFAK